MYKGEDYWDSHGTMSGKRDRYSEGSVADRGGNYEKLGFTYTQFTAGKKSSNGYGFGKRKKKARRLGGGY